MPLTLCKSLQSMDHKTVVSTLILLHFTYINNKNENFFSFSIVNILDIQFCFDSNSMFQLFPKLFLFESIVCFLSTLVYLPICLPEVCKAPRLFAYVKLPLNRVF